MTCHFVLLARTKPVTVSVFYGQDYSLFEKHRTNLPIEYTVNSFADVAQIPTSFDLNEFGKKLRSSFRDSKAKVHSIINIVYLIKRSGSTSSSWESELLEKEGPRRRRGLKHLQVF